MTINERLKELAEKNFALRMQDRWTDKENKAYSFILEESRLIAKAIEQGRGEEEYSEEEFHQKDYKVDYSKGYVNISYIEIMADY